jgi:hypothetical protein
MNLQFDASYAEKPGGVVTAANAVGSSPYVTAEQFTIRAAEVDQRSVRPGETVTVTAEYGSDFGQIVFAPDIDTDHPDYCSFPQFGFSPGADLFLEVDFGSTTTSDGGCWDVSNNESVVTSLDVAAPFSGGSATIDIRLKGRTTDQVYDSETIEIEVDERAPTNPDPPEEPDPPEDGDGGDGGNPFDNLLSQITLGTDNAAVPLVILVVILVALLYLTAI